MKTKWIILLGGLIFFGCSNEESVLLSFDDQLARDILFIDQYLTDNNIEAVEHASGLRYVIHRSGDGVLINLIDKIHVNWVGKLLDERVYDEQDTSFNLTDAPLGWQVVLPGFHVGDSVTLYLPSGFALRGQSGGIVDANENLIYEIDIKGAGIRSEEFQLQLETDTAKINKYLVDNGITAESHSSGFRYIIHSQGAGSWPTLISKVTVKLTGNLLDGSVFEASNGISEKFYLTGRELGWQMGVQLMKAGGRATFYFPSGMAYGSVGTDFVAANEPVIFEVELVAFE